MNSSKPPQTSSAIQQAIRARHERQAGLAAPDPHIAQREAELLADIEAFDLDAAMRQAGDEFRQPAPPAARREPALTFPDLSVASVPSFAPGARRASPAPGAASPVPPPAGGGLLAELRRQAAQRQEELQQVKATQVINSEAIDQALKRIFSYLHDLAEQLNVVKPPIHRAYALVDQYALEPMRWQEGFADYRAQSQSDGALFERVTLNYRLSGGAPLRIRRDTAAALERLRAQLFDYGLAFDCQEFRNERRFVERADFTIRGELSVSIRWRADFAQGGLILETRNLERLGSVALRLTPAAVDPGLLDEFGRLILAQPNRFRDALRR